jgi:phage-related holin
MSIVKFALIFVGVILVAFLVASIAFFGEHAFLLWVSIILLVIYAITGLVAARRDK